MMDDRSLKIDTLRGLACILLVAYHIVGSDSDSGLRISEGVYRDLNDILAYIRMPLFTFLSGVVYAFWPVKSDSKVFILKKARRLLLPMLTVGTGFVLIQYFISGSNSTVENWHLIHIVPVAHFWFIESLFLIFILIVFLEKFKFLDEAKSWLIVLFLASVLHMSPLYSSYFSFSGFLYLTPFFLAGLGIQRYGLIRHINKSTALVALFLIIAIVALIFMEVLPMYGERSLPALLLGLVTCVAFMSFGLRWKMLARIGVYSYSIYLFHVFFTACSRIILNKLGEIPIEFIFIVSFLSGICGPVMVEKTLEKFNVCRVLLLGKAPIKRLRSSPLSLSFADKI